MSYSTGYNLKLKCFIISILFLSIIYWGLTILYCSPDNYIKIKLKNTLEIFESKFFQKWEFFAPPPTVNNRLYFYFFDNNKNHITTVEASQPIIAEKIKKAPFNINEQFLDYLINNSIFDIRNYLLDRQKELSYKLSSKNKSKEIYKEKFDKDSSEYVQNTVSFKNLLKYSEIIKSKNPFLSKASFVQIRLAEVQIPKFINRRAYTDKYDSKENLIFQSTLINY